MPNRGSEAIPRTSGLVRRFVALCIDTLLLGAAGIALTGILPGGWCASVGVMAPLIGLAVAILYTAILNSGIGGGRTVGKRFCAIRVVGANGRPVSFGVSLGRSAILWIAIAQPPMIRDLALQSRSGLVVVLSMFLAGAAALGTLYLLLFGGARQGLHDWIAGTFVVRAFGAPEIAPASLGRDHRYALAGLFVLLGVVIAVQAPSQMRQAVEFRSLEGQLRQIEAFHQLRHFQTSGKTLDVSVQWKRPPVSFVDAQRRVAAIVLRGYPDVDRFPQMKVAVSCACDLGVLGRVVKWGAVLEESRTAPPADWRRIAFR
jgi:uncharacterized RDD family membrane protein YckC